SGTPADLLPRANPEIAELCKPYLGLGARLSWSNVPSLKHANLSKNGFVKAAELGFRRGGRNIIARFLRRAIHKNELYDFYAVMQLPPEFFKTFPKWEQYAKKIVERTSAEYAKYLEQLCRTEADHTVSAIGGGREEEEQHQHEWESYDEDEHRCSECHETENHYDWEDASADGHTCTVCGYPHPHDFDTDHECTDCKGTYDHNWQLTGDQEWTCESGDTPGGDYAQGCGATTDYRENDRESPLFGDFWEERHQHQWQEAKSDQGDAVVCPQCGRAFIDET